MVISSRYIKSFSVLLLTLVVIFIAFFYFSVWLTTVSVPEDYYEEISDKIKDDIDIYKNFYGIPHIISVAESDGFFAQGYLHAQDRLWQMDYTRRLAEGKLSEIFGDETIDVDFFMRSLDLKDSCTKIYNNLSAKSKQIIKNYTDGVNCFIKNNTTKFSFEFGALDYLPEEWKPVDCIIVSRALSFEMSLSFWLDIAFGSIAEKYGIDALENYIPRYPHDAPYITDETVAKSTQALLEADSKTPLHDIAFLQKIVQPLNTIREKIGLNSGSIGSNSWAVRTNKNKEKSSTIMANDPHLLLSLPPKWYPIHISAGKYNAAGLSIPGLPLVLSGRNDNIAWGITNLMLDDCDFFIEKVNETGKKYFSEDKNEYIEFDYVLDTIKVANSDDKIYYRRYTNISPVVSDFHLLKKDNRLISFDKDYKNELLNKYVLTYKWLAHSNSDEILGMYKLNKARNFAEFKSASTKWLVPALNFTYADKIGNIAVIPFAKLPGRNQTNPNIPNPTWNTELLWNKEYSNIQLPNIYNPAKQYVFSANNKLDRSFKYHISSHWEPASRAERIDALLSEPNDFSTRDIQFIQNDFVSPYAEQFLNLTLPILKSQDNLLDTLERTCLKDLEDWDYLMSSLSHEAAIFNVFFQKLIFNTFADELGLELYKQYVFVSNIPSRKIMELLEQENNILFDNKKTESTRETKAYTLFKSFKDAVKMLSSQYGSNIKTWRWGKLHKLTLEHPFSNIDFLRPSVTLGEFEVGGNNTTINNTDYSIHESFAVRVGASSRVVANMQDSVLFLSLPGGVSGDPMNPNYRNQVQLWLTGGYVELPIGSNPNSNFELKTKIIKTSE